MATEDHLPLAPRDLLILAVLVEAPLHGYGIIKAVESRSRSGVLLDPANLYRVLRRMRRQGWIRLEGDGVEDSGWLPPRPSGPRRKMHGITPCGEAILAAELARLERLLQQVRAALA